MQHFPNKPVRESSCKGQESTYIFFFFSIDFMQQA